MKLSEYKKKLNNETKEYALEVKEKIQAFKQKLRYKLTVFKENNKKRKGGSPVIYDNINSFFRSAESKLTLPDRITSLDSITFDNLCDYLFIDKLSLSTVPQSNAFYSIRALADHYKILATNRSFSKRNELKNITTYYINLLCYLLEINLLTQNTLTKVGKIIIILTSHIIDPPLFFKYKIECFNNKYSFDDIIKLLYNNPSLDTFIKLYNDAMISLELSKIIVLINDYFHFMKSTLTADEKTAKLTEIRTELDKIEPVEIERCLNSYIDVKIPRHNIPPCFYSDKTKIIQNYIELFNLITEGRASDSEISRLYNQLIVNLTNLLICISAKNNLIFFEKLFNNLLIIILIYIKKASVFNSEYLKSSLNGSQLATILNNPSLTYTTFYNAIKDHLIDELKMNEYDIFISLSLDEQIDILLRKNDKEKVKLFSLLSPNIQFDLFEKLSSEEKANLFSLLSRELQAILFEKCNNEMSLYLYSVLSEVDRITLFLKSTEKKQKDIFKLFDIPYQKKLFPLLEHNLKALLLFDDTGIRLRTDLFELLKSNDDKAIVFSLLSVPKQILLFNHFNSKVKLDVIYILQYIYDIDYYNNKTFKIAGTHILQQYHQYKKTKDDEKKKNNEIIVEPLIRLNPSNRDLYRSLIPVLSFFNTKTHNERLILDFITSTFFNKLYYMYDGKCKNIIDEIITKYNILFDNINKRIENPIPTLTENIIDIIILLVKLMKCLINDKTSFNFIKKLIVSFSGYINLIKSNSQTSHLINKYTIDAESDIHFTIATNFFKTSDIEYSNAKQLL